MGHKAMKQVSICVVGSLNMDLVVRTPHLPHAGRQSVVVRLRHIWGGKVQTRQSLPLV